MKKISLKNVKEILSRKEMRVIAGGYGVFCYYHEACYIFASYGNWYCYNNQCVHKG